MEFKRITLISSSVFLNNKHLQPFKSPTASGDDLFNLWTRKQMLFSSTVHNRSSRPEVLC